MKDFAPRPVEIIDTTLRDGAQSPTLADHRKYFFNQREKLEIFHALDAYGVRTIEVFSPVVSPQEGRDLAAMIERRNAVGSNMQIVAHIRCRPQDVDAAINAGVDGLHMYMGTSEVSRRANHGKDLDIIAANARKLLSDIKKNHPHLVLRFSGEDAFRTSEDDLKRVYDEVVPLVDRIGTPDTVGVANPQKVKERVLWMREEWKDTPLEGHFHNDRQYATINAIEAIIAGMQYLDTTVLGIAERSGITSTTALLFNLYLEDPKLVEGYNLQSSYPLNVLVADIIGMPVPPTEPISGTNRTHFAGVHANAIIKDRETYEAHHLERFGVTDQDLLAGIGPLSGWHIIHYVLTQYLNFTDVDTEKAQVITEEFKEEVYKMNRGQTTPLNLLDQIAMRYRLTRLILPPTHTENIQSAINR